MTANVAPVVAELTATGGEGALFGVSGKDTEGSAPPAERHELERLVALLGAGFDLTESLALASAGYDVLGFVDISRLPVTPVGGESK